MSNLTLSLKIIADASGLNRETEKARNELMLLAEQAETFGRRSMLKYAGAASVATVALSELSTELAQGATWAGYAAGVAIGTTRTLMFAKELQGLSAATAMSAQELRLWQLAGGEFGVSADDVSKTLSELAANIAEMQSAGEKSGLAETLGKIGMSLNEVRGMKPDELLGAVASRLNEIQGLSSLQKQSILEELAGGASKLAPLLANNAEKLREIQQHAETVGAIITKDQEARLNAANKELSDMRLALEGLSNSFGQVGAEIINTFGDDFGQWLDKEAEHIKQWSQEAIAEVNRLYDIFRNAGGLDGAGLRAVYEEMFPDLSAFTDGVGAFFDGFYDAVMRVWDAAKMALSPVIDLLNGITGSGNNTLETIGALVGYFGGAAAIVMTSTAAYGLLAGAIGTIGTAAVAAAGGLATAGRALQVLGVAAAMNPIGALVTVVAGAGVWMYKFAESNNEAARTITTANGKTLEFGETLGYVTGLSNEYRNASTERQAAIREEIDNIIKLTNQRRIEAQQQLDYLNQLDAETAAGGEFEGNQFRKGFNDIYKFGLDVFGLDQDEAKAVINESAQITNALTQQQDNLGKSTAQLAQEQKDKAQAETEATGATIRHTEEAGKNSGVLLENAKTSAVAAKAVHDHGDALKSAIEALQKQRIELEHGKLAAEYYTDRLNGLADAEARAKAGASQYNSFLQERKRLQEEAAGMTGSLVDKYNAHLETIGLSPDAMSGIDAIRASTDRAVESAKQYQQAIEAVGKSAETTGATVASSMGKASSSLTASIQKQASQQAGTLSIIDQVSKTSGVDANLMKSMAWIESKFKADAKSPLSSASGLYQFINSTASNYGLSGKQFDARANAEAYTRFLKDNMAQMQRSGIETSNANMYLAHQQGVGGLKQLMDIASGKRAMTADIRDRLDKNGGKGLSAGEFLDKWRAKYTEVEASVQAVFGKTQQVTIATNQTASATGAVADQVIEYGGAMDTARVAAGDTAGLLESSLNIEMGKLLQSAEQQTQQAKMTGAEYRQHELEVMKIGDARASIIMQEEQIANYTAERAKIEEDALAAKNGMAAQYTKELEHQNLSHGQIADLVSRKMQASTDKILHDAQQQTQQLALSADQWRRIELAQDGYTDGQIASIQQAEKLLETTKQIREAADRVGDGLLDGLMKAATGADGVVDSLKSTVENAFADMVLKPTLQPITKAVSDGITGMMTGQSNPWAGLQQAYSQTMASMQAGGWQGAVTTAGVAATVSGLFGGSQAEQTGAAIGGAIGNTIGGPVVGAIGSVLGHLAGGLFEDDDSARAKFTGGEPTDGYAFVDRNKHLYASSQLGTFGFQADGTHDLGEQGESELEAFVKRMAEVDNAIAKFIPASEIERVKADLSSFQHTGLDFADLFKQRLVIVTSGLSDAMRGLVDYSQDADGILSRLNDLIAIQNEAVPALRDMNLHIGDTADAALVAATGLADAAGGLQNLTSVASAYYDAVYSEEEQKQISIRNAQAAIDAFNLANNAQIASLAGLRAYVEGLDLTIPANHQASIAAMGLADDLKLLAGAAGNVASAASEADTASQALLDSANSKLSQQQTVFDLFNNQLSDITRGLDSQLQALESSYRDQIRAYERAQDVASGLRDALLQLKTGDLSTLVPAKQLEAARAEFERLQKAAKGGDVEAAQKLESAGETLLRLSREYNASSEDYSKDFARVQDGWQSIAGLLERQQDPQQDMLAAQRKLIDQAASQAMQLAAVYGGIIGGNDLLTLMGKNIDNLPPDIANALKSVLSGLTVGGGATGSTLSKSEYKSKALSAIDGESSAAGKLSAIYQTLLSRTPDAAGLKYWLGEMDNGMTILDVLNSIIDSSEFKQLHPNSHATGLYAVPYDNYSANLHAGEAVIDAASMAAMRKYGIPLRSQASDNRIVVTVDQAKLIEKVDALTAEVKQLRAERSADAQYASGQRERHIGQSVIASRDTVRAMKMRYRN